MSAHVSELLLEAAGLLVVGMVFVYLFLSLLIIVVNLIARFCRKYPGQIEQPTHVRKKRQPVSKSDDVSPATVAAIGAAIHQHRQSK